WDVYEFYSATNPATGHTFVCDDIARTKIALESQAIMLKKGGTWTPATPGNSVFSPARPNPSSYKCPAVKFQVRNPNDHWLVTECPTPWAPVACASECPTIRPGHRGRVVGTRPDPRACLRTGVEPRGG